MATDPGELLRQRNLRVTPQRRAILGAFRRGVDEHLSADEVHARAASVVPEIGRGTVYATLAELTELGLLAATGSPEPTRYETNVAPHEHFRCRLCLRTFDVELAAPAPHALRERGFEVERITVIAEGVCAQCGDYRRGLHEGAAALRSAPQLGADVVEGLACTRHETPVGPLVMAASPDGIVRLAFEDHADFDALAARAKTRRGGRESRSRVDHALDALDGYFGGALRAADDIVDWPTVGAISPGAVEATRAIPLGEHRSYERLDVAATAFDRGYAMGTNPVPVLLPCHRVTRGAERLDDYVGGVGRRDELVDLER